MDGSGRSRDTPGSGFKGPENARPGSACRDLLTKFESLGGSGHGSEFAMFQRNLGAEPGGLLAWADLAGELLIHALESRFDGVGLQENTIVFAPDHSDEWWTKDKRYWMAMRSFIKTRDADLEQATAEVCHSLQSRRQTLIEDLESGKKIFVFKTMHRNLSETEINRLHGAIRGYGDATLFYVRKADENLPAGAVHAPAPGLLIGAIDHFAFSPDNKPIGPADDSWLALCQEASRRHTPQPVRVPAGPDTAIVQRHCKPRRGRRIVLIGNCQMQAMAGLHKRFVAGRSGDIMTHVPSYQDLTDAHRNAIQRADIVVEQLFDMKPQADTEAVSTTTPRLFIPMVTAAFLWPFAGSPHPKNAGCPFLAGGPYGGEASDSYLNRLILSGIDPEAAVETYANLDVNSRTKLDRLFEIVMDRQRSRDAVAGYKIAGLMEAHFRSEQIFLSPYHPNVRIATALAGQFFEQLGAQRDEIDRMQTCTRITPFPKGELPFHPSVCRHFGLDFVRPDRRYRFMNEGLFTFREYALRYMRYEWNEALEAGIHLSQTGQWSEAHERLTASVQRSPFSAAAHNALSHVLSHRGARDDAITAMRRAVEIEPEVAAYRANLGNLLRQAGEFDHALTELRSAVAIDPGEPHYRVLLAHLLRQRGDAEGACDALRQATRLDPYSADLQADLAGALEATGDMAGAVVALQDAIAMEPANEKLLVRLAQLLGRLHRLDEAITAARSAVALTPESSRARMALSSLLLRTGDPAGALSEAHAAAVSEPDSATVIGHLGHVLVETGDLSAAEAAFRRAAELDPRSAHFKHELSSVLNRQQRVDEAIVAARESADLQPGNPNRVMHLAGLLAKRGDLVDAQAPPR